MKKIISKWNFFFDLRQCDIVSVLHPNDANVFFFGSASIPFSLSGRQWVRMSLNTMEYCLTKMTRIRNERTNVPYLKMIFLKFHLTTELRANTNDSIRPWSSRIHYIENNRQNISSYLELVICQNNKKKIDYFWK